MKTLFIECAMGAAGDMLMGALSEITDAPDDFVNGMNDLGLPGVHIERERVARCGIIGTHMKVTVDGEEEHEHHHHGEEEHEHHHHGEEEHEHHHIALDAHANAHVHAHVHGEGHVHHHAGLGDIAALIGALNVSDKVKADALAVYNIIAEAEATCHGRPVDQIHFHEVGTVDAVTDVIGVCVLMERIGAERVVVSPINVGSGMVRCAHGLLPVPAPATAYILRGLPMYSGRIRAELCTPTGAALLKYFAGEFGNLPLMRVERIGYGMGTKEFDAANCVRVYIGENDN